VAKEARISEELVVKKALISGPRLCPITSAARNSRSTTSAVTWCARASEQIARNVSSVRVAR
jgi:hypothetical protein